MVQGLTRSLGGTKKEEPAKENHPTPPAAAATRPAAKAPAAAPAEPVKPGAEALNSAEHLTRPAAPKGGQINYGHNEADFNKTLTDRHGKVLSSKPSSTFEGIKAQEYQLPKLNGDGTVDASKAPNKPQTKTTFDGRWNEQNLAQMHERMFNGIKPVPGENTTVKVGNDHFSRNINSKGEAKFYMESGAPKPGTNVIERPVSAFKDLPLKPGVAAPEAGAAKPGAAPEGRLAKVGRIGGGALAAGLSPFQLKSGLESLNKGDKVNGVADTAGSVLNAAGGIGLIAGSTVAAPVALAGAAGLDAGRTIINGVRSGNTEQVVTGGIKGLGAGMMGAAPFVAGSIVGAPVGLVLGLGGAALYGGASLYENREAIGNAISNGASSVKNWVGSFF